MRRKKGVLIPLELSILVACLDLKTRGAEQAHGFLITKQIGDQTGAKMLTSHGTLYKALGRMEKTGLLKSRWEDPVAAANESRPRRRLYRVTAEGVAAFDAARAPRPQPVSSSKRATTMSAWPLLLAGWPDKGLGAGVHGGTAAADPHRTDSGDQPNNLAGLRD